MMEISVIIPTYNGAHKLPATLAALAKQTVQAKEILVIVDGSKDNTAEVLEEWTRRMPTLKPHFQQNSGRATVRNHGAALATGELLIFFDDDIWPRPDCIAQHVTHHIKYPGSVLTGAQMDMPAKIKGSVTEYKSWAARNWLRPLVKFADVPITKDSIFITAANFSISKKLFSEIGGFDDRLRDAEDYDLAVRLWKNGIPLFYRQDAFAWHDDPVTCSSYIRRQREYSSAHRLLLVNHPEWEQEGFMQPARTPAGLKKTIFLFFCKKFWINAVDKNKLAWLPTRIRYKIYDLIITGNGVYFPQKIKL
jgi:glycosyltransferase involved in cell wall biosynthesis